MLPGSSIPSLVTKTLLPLIDGLVAGMIWYDLRNASTRAVAAILRSIDRKVASLRTWALICAHRLEGWAR